MTKPVWAHAFDSSKRHCWPLNNGTRRLDTSAPEYDDETWEIEKNLCTNEHIHDPKVVGNVEWLRFIHEFGGDRFGSVTIKPTGEKTFEGVEVYCEVYKDFKVFLKHEEGWAYIECFNPNYVKDCEEAYISVQDRYVGEVIERNAQ